MKRIRIVTCLNIGLILASVSILALEQTSGGHGAGDTGTSEMSGAQMSAELVAATNGFIESLRRCGQANQTLGSSGCMNVTAATGTTVASTTTEPSPYNKPCPPVSGKVCTLVSCTTSDYYGAYVEATDDCTVPTIPKSTDCTWLPTIDGPSAWAHEVIPGECGGPHHESCCFPGHLRVLMADGSTKAIRDVKVGDRVQGRWGTNTVLGLQRPLLGERTLVGINGALYSSDDHLMWTATGWAAANPEAYAANDYRCVVPLIGADGTATMTEYVGIHPDAVKTL